MCLGRRPLTLHQVGCGVMPTLYGGLTAFSWLLSSKSSSLLLMACPEANVMTTLGEFFYYSRVLAPRYSVISSFVLSCESKRDMFDACIISDLILHRILPLSPFLPCGTLQGVSLVGVKHQNDHIIVSCKRHQSLNFSRRWIILICQCMAALLRLARTVPLVST